MKYWYCGKSIRWVQHNTNKYIHEKYVVSSFAHLGPTSAATFTLSITPARGFADRWCFAAFRRLAYAWRLAYSRRLARFRCLCTTATALPFSFSHGLDGIEYGRNMAGKAKISIVMVVIVAVCVCRSAPICDLSASGNCLSIGRGDTTTDLGRTYGHRGMLQEHQSQEPMSVRDHHPGCFQVSG